MKSFSDTGLTEEQLKLSCVCAVVKKAFEWLRVRWKLLMKKNDSNIKNVL